MRSDRPRYAINNFAEGTAEENKATAQGTITYFGTYSVSEADRTIAIHVRRARFQDPPVSLVNSAFATGVVGTATEVEVARDTGDPVVRFIVGRRALPSGSR